MNNERPNPLFMMAKNAALLGVACDALDSIRADYLIKAKRQRFDKLYLELLNMYLAEFNEVKDVFPNYEEIQHNES